MENYPDGKLVCTKNGKYTKLYESDGKNNVYLKKSQYEHAVLLAEKKYINSKITDLKHELMAIDFYLRHHNEEGTTEKLLNNYPAMNDLLKPYFSTKYDNWKDAEFISNPFNPEHLIHSSVSGNKLRSKSEVIIDMLLYTNKIPYRYECVLELGEQTLYPDFTIVHPETGKTYYWEHFGMMDSPSYYNKAYNKLNLYAANGIIPTLNLILSYETSAHPFTVDAAEKIINEYFK